MFEQIEGREKRLEELHRLISDPEVISNPELYKKYAKEQADLDGLVSRYKEFKKTEAEIAETEKLLASKHEPELVKLAQEELERLRAARSRLARDIEEMTFVEDPEGNKNIIMEIRAGTGGVEASLFAAELYRMYARYAAKKNCKVEMINASLSEKGGFKEVIFSVAGRAAYKYFKYESGTHRVQRVPVTESSGRLHTSAVTVAVLPEAEEVEVDVRPEDLKIEVFRAGGRGGQHVNVTDSAVRITHGPSGIVASCQDERSQHKNKAKAMRVLRARLYDKCKSEQMAKVSLDRKKQVGSGDRSEKIRTYNFPDRRVTDHRINLSLFNLPEIMEGGLDELIEALRAAEKKRQGQS